MPSEWRIYKEKSRYGISADVFFLNFLDCFTDILAQK